MGKYSELRMLNYAYWQRDSVSLDLGGGLAATHDGPKSLRQILRAFVTSAGMPLRFTRAYTVQGSPIFMVTRPGSPYRPMRMSIGIGETWLDAVAQAYEMWVTGT